MTKPPEVKGVTPKVIHQQIKSEDLFETDLIFEPKYVPWVYINNIISRVLARMTGQGPYGPVVIKCTQDGSIAVVQRGGAFDDYQKMEHDFVVLFSSTTTDATTPDHLIDSTKDFIVLGVKKGDTVKNITDPGYAFVEAVAQHDLTISPDIMATAEDYDIIPCHEFTFKQQVTRIDIFTYDGKVDYQLTRDNVKSYGAKIELFEDSFYSLDFFTLKVKATAVTFTALTPTRSKVMGWFREAG